LTRGKELSNRLPIYTHMYVPRSTHPTIPDADDGIILAFLPLRGGRVAAHAILAQGLENFGREIREPGSFSGTCWIACTHSAQACGPGLAPMASPILSPDSGFHLLMIPTAIQLQSFNGVSWAQLDRPSRWGLFQGVVYHKRIQTQLRFPNPSRQQLFGNTVQDKACRLPGLAYFKLSDTAYETLSHGVSQCMLDTTLSTSATIFCPTGLRGSS
jgi:hypothetical protein